LFYVSEHSLGVDVPRPEVDNPLSKIFRFFELTMSNQLTDQLILVAYDLGSQLDGLPKSLKGLLVLAIVRIRSAES
jgi:hypothetical protein